MTSPLSAETRLGEFLREQFTHLIMGDLPYRLYHYTTSEGMQAIVASGVLRAYNLGQMNDFAEGRYAASVMRAYVDRGYAVEPNSDAMELLNAIRQQFTTLTLSNVFALSFTPDSDESGMWRLYADRGRGFSFAIPIYEALSWAGDNHKGMMLKCSYDSKMLAAFCEQAVSKIREIYLSDVALGTNPDPIQYANMFLQNISWFAPAFKPEAWQDEKEWRFIFVRPQTEHKTLLNGRTYIELPLIPPTKENPHPITAICGGPDCDYVENIVPLQSILYNNGYGGEFPVYLSQKHVTRLGRESPIMRPATLTTV